jgi:hypothetical protein
LLVASVIQANSQCWCPVKLTLSQPGRECLFRRKSRPLPPVLELQRQIRRIAFTFGGLAGASFARLTPSDIELKRAWSEPVRRWQGSPEMLVEFRGLRRVGKGRGAEYAIRQGRISQNKTLET